MNIALIAVFLNNFFLVSQPANFCSVSEGIFLCFNCAGEHRGYYKPKTVKSISLDEWYLYIKKRLIF